MSKRCGSGSSSNKFKKITIWRVFCHYKRDKRLVKSKKQWRLCKFTLKIWINLQLLPIFLHFSVFILQIFPPGSGSRSENECGSGSTGMASTSLTFYCTGMCNICLFLFRTVQSPLVKMSPSTRLSGGGGMVVSCFLVVDWLNVSRLWQCHSFYPRLARSYGRLLRSASYRY